MASHDTTTTAPASRPRLGDLINAATRTTHTRLNKTILSRLPLALPPSTTTPALYTTGLLHIAPIYLVFESLWLNLTSPIPPPPPYLTPTSLSLFPHDLATTPPPPAPSPPQCPPHILHILKSLLPPSLPRTPSLHADLSRLLASPPDQPLRLPPTTSPRLSAFLAHTRRSVAKNPHVLLAYAWVLYMALFSGGRFILATLESAGPEFWGGHDTPPPLSFFRFPGADNGEEEVKGQFKARLAELEAGLSERETEQVVQEARCVFEGLVLVVGEVDVLLGGDAGQGDGEEEGWVAGLMPRILTGRRVRDSVVLARERRDVKARGRGRLEEGGGGGRVGSVVPVLGEVERQAAEVAREMVVEDAGGVVEGVTEGKVVRFDPLPRRSLDGGTRQLAGPTGMRNLVLLLGALGVLWGLGRGSWAW